jgi:hypothetical protein
MIAREITQRTYAKIIIGIVFFLVIVTYGGFKMYSVLLGPEIVIESPQSGSTIMAPLITVTGQAKRIAKLYFNDRKIFTDDSGNFQESLLLARGYNILELEAEDGFGRKVTKHIELVLQ